MENSVIDTTSTKTALLNYALLTSFVCGKEVESKGVGTMVDIINGIIEVIKVRIGRMGPKSSSSISGESHEESSIRVGAIRWVVSSPIPPTSGVSLVAAISNLSLS